jgi:AcrR family transcriptional regulator
MNMGPDTPRVKRTYDSSGRQANAEARRYRVVEVAARMFASHGFRATSLNAIAAEAGVSPESIYKTFGSKGALAKAVFDRAIAGDDDPRPVVERPEARAVFEASLLEEKIALFAAGLADRQRRSAQVQILIRDGRHVDDALSTLWEDINAEATRGMTMMVDHLGDVGLLAEHLKQPAIDVLCTYAAIDHYERLVLERRWSDQLYAAWLGQAVLASLASLASLADIRTGLSS